MNSYRKYFIFSDNNNNFIISWLFIFSFLIFSINVNAQVSQPTPPPTRETPQIVSRDTDSITPPQINEDVNETTNPDETSTDTINLPPQDQSTVAEKEDATAKKQKQMMLYLDLLTKTEQRSATLRTQLYDLLEKQNSLNSRIKQIEYSLQPDNISNVTSLTGSLRPEDLRQQRKQSLELERANLETLLDQINGSLANLQESVRKADVLVEKIRTRFEKIVDDALSADEELF